MTGLKAGAFVALADAETAAGTACARAAAGVSQCSAASAAMLAESESFFMRECPLKRLKTGSGAVVLTWTLGKPEIVRRKFITVMRIVTVVVCV